MKHDFPEFTDSELIGLIVDGEITGEELQRILERWEGNHERWRELSFAFLETHALRQAMKSIVVPCQPAKTVTSSQTRSVEHLPAVPIEASGRRRLAPVLRIATALLIVLGFGWWIGKNSALAPTSDPKNSDLSQLASDGHSEQVSSRPSASAAQSKVPVISDYVRAQLKRQGLAVEEQSTLFPVELPDGRKAFVPIHSVQLRIEQPKEIL